MGPDGKTQLKQTKEIEMYFINYKFWGKYPVVLKEPHRESKAGCRQNRTWSTHLYQDPQVTGFRVSGIRLGWSIQKSKVSVKPMRLLSKVHLSGKHWKTMAAVDHKSVEGVLSGTYIACDSAAMQGRCLHEGLMPDKDNYRLLGQTKWMHR